MNLGDKLNKALADKCLQPTKPIPCEAAKPAIELEISSRGVGLPAMYPSLESGIKAASKIKPDEFGTRVIVVEKVDKTSIKLPMTETVVHKYIIDDIQKMAGGGYEVHLVEKNQK